MASRSEFAPGTWGWRANIALPMAIQLAPDGTAVWDSSQSSQIAVYQGRTPGLAGSSMRTFVQIQESLLNQLLRLIQAEPGLWESNAPVAELSSQLARLTAFLSSQFVRCAEEGKILYFSKESVYQQTTLMMWHTGLYTKSWDPLYLISRLNNGLAETPAQRWAAIVLATQSEVTSETWWSQIPAVQELWEQLRVGAAAVALHVSMGNDSALPQAIDPWSRPSLAGASRHFDRSHGIRVTEADFATLLRDSPTPVSMIARPALEKSIEVAFKAAKAQPGCCSARLFRETGPKASKPRVQLLLPLWIAGGPTIQQHGCDITRADGALAVELRSDGGAGYVYVPAAILEPHTALLDARVFGPLYHSWLRARNVGQQQQQQAPAQVPAQPLGQSQANQGSQGVPSVPGTASTGNSGPGSKTGLSPLVSGQQGPGGGPLGGPFALPLPGSMSLQGGGALSSSNANFSANLASILGMGGSMNQSISISGGMGMGIGMGMGQGQGGSGGVSTGLGGSLGVSKPVGGGSAYFDFSNPAMGLGPGSGIPGSGLDSLSSLAGLPDFGLGPLSQGTGLGSSFGGVLGINLDKLLDTPARPVLHSGIGGRGLDHNAGSASSDGEEGSSPRSEDGSDSEGDRDSVDISHYSSSVNGSSATAKDIKATAATATAPAPELILQAVPSNDATRAARAAPSGGAGSVSVARADAFSALIEMGIHVTPLPASVPGSAKKGGPGAPVWAGTGPKATPSIAMLNTSVSSVSSGAGSTAAGAPIPAPVLPGGTGPGVGTNAGAGAQAVPMPAPSDADSNSIRKVSHTRFKGSVLSVVLKEDKPHGFICVTRKKEPELWGRVSRESPDTMRMQEGREVATIVFQASDMEDNKGVPMVEGIPDGAKWPGPQYFGRAIKELPLWKGLEVSFEAEYSRDYKRFVAHRVRLHGTLPASTKD